MCGSDSASLYLEVLSVDDQDILCEAKNGAVMDGLMTVRGVGLREPPYHAAAAAAGSIVTGSFTRLERYTEQLDNSTA